VKTLGTGFGEMAAFHDIEILNNDQGKPEVFFSDALKQRFKNPEVLISISHCKD
jgi:holo-[acyl-carrier protein] synthase